MRMRAWLAVALAVAVWAASGALTAVEAADYALRIYNLTGRSLKVYVFSEDDGVRLSGCNIWLLGGGGTDLSASSNEPLEIPDKPWPLCGAYDAYYVVAYYEWGAEWGGDSIRSRDIFARKGDTVYIRTEDFEGRLP